MTNLRVKVGLLLGVSFLAACADAPHQPSPVVEHQPPAQQQEPAETPLPDAPFRIALLLPLSGPSKDVGADALNGAMMGFYELHSPAKVELQILDTLGTPQGARAAAGRAIGNSANVLIGPVFSTNVQEAAAIAAPQGVDVLALSNDKRLAHETVKVLGPHLEAEAQAILQLATEQGGESILLFAPNNAYGKRLNEEFEMLAEQHPRLVLQSVLFHDHATVNELTKLVSVTGDFQQRADHLKEVLGGFTERWQAEQDTSKALTQTVDLLQLTDRWNALYPVTCVEEPLQDAALETGDLQVPDDIPETSSPPATELIMDLPEPEAPPVMKTYENARVCEAPALPDDIEASLDAEVVAEQTPALEDTPPAPVEEISNAEAQAPDAQDAQETEQIDAPQPAPEEPVLIVEEAAPPEPSAQELLDARLATDLQEARLDILQEMASCINFLSEKAYEEQKGVDAMMRTFARREVLGPPRFDAIVLPLADVRLRIVSSLFDFYHIGPQDVTFLGTSLWGQAENLYDEPSLRGAQWLSVSRAFTPEGRQRFNALFHEEPSKMSALAYDAVRVAFDKTQPPAPGRTVPGNDSFIIGESGVFRVNDDGTNERRIEIKKVAGGTQEADTLTERQRASLRGIGRTKYLERICLGAR